MTKVGFASAASCLLAAGLLSACGGGDSTPKLAVESQAEDRPHAVAFDPPMGAVDVDPSRTSLSVRFDRAMDPQGWAWVVENPATAPEIGDSSWDPALRTNTVQVKLQPGRDYVVWVNSPQYLYFKDASGRTLEPLRWAFSTRASVGSTSPVAPVAAHATSSAPPPRVVGLEPRDGATDVDPALTALRATFDRPMEESWAWVTEGRDFPEAAGESYFEPGATTVVLPVRLEPGRSYVIWLNSAQNLLFRDRAGSPLVPLRWSFTTRGAGPTKAP